MHEDPETSRVADGDNDAKTLPEDLEKEIQLLEKEFWLNTKKLKQISERFVKELKEGLSEHGQNIAMYVTWVLGFPNGRETGQFLTLDLGGTNLRVCWISLRGKGKEPEVTQSQYTLPDEVKTGHADEFWSFIAGSLDEFIQEHDLKASSEEPLKLGFTFSYPAIQDYIDHGILQTWTKGFEIKDVEGNDVAAQLRDALSKKDLPIRLVALVNDTTGAMVASAYNDPDTVIGAIFGTGCNAAYMDKVGSIPKLKHPDLNNDTPMAINCEYGAFDNARKVLPVTKYDTEIDRRSPKPGEQAFEKMSAGLYLGEIFRLVLIDLHNKDLSFRDQDLSSIKEPYSIDTSILSEIEEDNSKYLTQTRDRFKKNFGLDSSQDDLNAIHRLAVMIAVRGARLSACGIAAICLKNDVKQGHVAADGSVANKHPKFKQRWCEALSEILEWPQDRKKDPIILTSAEDGSGVGAAIIAAMTLERIKSGQKAGIKEQ